MESAAHAAKPLVVVANLDVVKPKNLYQSEALPEFEFLFVSYGGSMGVASSNGIRFATYPRNIVRRARFSWRLMAQQRRNIHHIELYTGNGSYVAAELLVAKLLGIKVVVAERGALLQYPAMAWTRRVALWLLYRFANRVWLREKWMPAALRKIVTRETFFNFNAIKLPKVKRRHDPRDIDLLWVNSFKPWRHPVRFCQALLDKRLADLRVVMIGLLDVTSADVRSQQQEAQTVAAAQVEFLPFGDPIPYYRRARYFVLPADIVFLNFALLEAMAYGVVPLVADVDGAHEIVDHGIDGFIFRHDPEGLQDALAHAKDLPEQEWQEMSRRAIEKVTEKFSLHGWAKQMRILYHQLAQD